MKKIRLGMVAMALLGLGAGSTPQATAQEYNQCWRRPEIDEQHACTAC